MNFLQKGLAGLESRLDKVLLDDGGNTAVVAVQPARNSMHVPAEAAEAARRGSGESVRRSGESARGNMAERLAAVVAAKSVARSGSPVKKATVAVEEEQKDGEKNPPEAKRNGTATRESPAPPPPDDYNDDDDDDGDSQGPCDLLATVALLREDLAMCELRRQEENAAASERIDALSEKVRYLSQESAAAAARERGSAATPAERKIAEKDEKIALLIEEGERLARGELELRTTIKKLRAQARESAESKKKLEAAERKCAQEREKGRAAAEAEKRALEKVKALAKVESEVEGLKQDKEALAAGIRGLEEKLGEQARMAADAEGRVQDEALENERKAASELRAQIERVRSEAAMVEEKLKGEIEDLKSKAERISEKARTREREMKAELSAMEGTVEALRARVEEASSGSAGDAHAKLLRQVETLQTQYSIASENWQGIEGSLLARVTSLEKERDDLSKKEGDTRRKAREMNLKYKTLESDLDTMRSRLKDLESDLASANELTATLRARLATAESATDSLTAAHRAERATWERELQARIQEERLKWEETTIPTTLTPATGTNYSPPPVLGPFRPNPPAAGSTTESYFLGYSQPMRKSTSRAPSIDPPRSSGGFKTPPVRSDNFPYLNTSLPAGDVDDYFDGMNTPSSPLRHPDLVSVSTVAAGPSVQLVERMSAAVRRLESEMAASREELGRVVSQRDEARAEMVELMREVEAKRSAEARVKVLESEVADTKMRLETTLLMLGEREERLGELCQDVDDLKAMYRELVLATSGGK